MKAELRILVEWVTKALPKRFRHEDWLFLRRHTGEYTVSYLGYNEQALETASGPAFKVCPVKGLMQAVEEIEKMVEGESEEEKKPEEPKTDGYGSKMFERTKMEVDGAYAVVELVVQVKCERWGPDCAIGQAATQAVEDATQKLSHILNDKAPEYQRKTHGVKLLGARCVRVICEAKRS